VNVSKICFSQHVEEHTRRDAILDLVIIDEQDMFIHTYILIYIAPKS